METNPPLPPPQSPRPPPTPGPVRRLLRWLRDKHVFGSLLIVLVATGIISAQVEDRTDFADSELIKDVESRWGAPVVQPAPSLRYVQSGTIFTELRPLAFERQNVLVDAEMNYRKRGLRYFSGFDFALTATYAVKNPEPHDIDVAFIFPIEVDKSQVLLSELAFKVDGADASLDLGASGNRLVWTGRIKSGASTEFFIRYRARGLDSFVYRLDPSLPARNVSLQVAVKGGENFDYPADVLAASSVRQSPGAVALGWAFPSLESGVQLGVILPSTKTFDALVATMARRAWVPFLAFLALLSVLSVRHLRPVRFYESYLLSAAYGFFFVLLAYFAAFMNFYLAYAIAALGLGAVVVVYLKRVFPNERLPLLCGTWSASMVVPTFAVLVPGYTGLIYTMEILSALLGLMVMSTWPSVRGFLNDFESDPSPSAQEAQ